MPIIATMHVYCNCECYCSAQSS